MKKVIYKNFIYESVKKKAEDFEVKKSAAEILAEKYPTVYRDGKSIHADSADLLAMKTDHNLFSHFINLAQPWVKSMATKLAMQYSSDRGEWVTWLTSAIWDRISKNDGSKDLNAGNVLSGAVYIARNSYKQAHMTRQKAPVGQAVAKAQGEWDSWVTSIISEDLKANAEAHVDVDGISVDDATRAVKYLATKYSDVISKNPPNIVNTLVDSNLYPRFVEYYKNILIPNIANKLSVTTTADSLAWENYFNSLVSDEVDGIMIEKGITPGEDDGGEEENPSEENGKSKKPTAKAIFRRRDGLASSIDAPAKGEEEGGEGMQVPDSSGSAPSDNVEAESNLNLLKYELSPEELFMLQSKLEGDSFDDIGAELGISKQAMGNRWKKMFEKHSYLFKKLVTPEVYEQLKKDNEVYKNPSAAMKLLKESICTTGAICIFESTNCKVHFFG